MQFNASKLSNLHSNFLKPNDFLSPRKFPDKLIFRKLLDYIPYQFFFRPRYRFKSFSRDNGNNNINTFVNLL